MRAHGRRSSWCGARRPGPLIDGRDFVIPDDVKTLAVPALAHRVLATAGLRLERGRTTTAVQEVIEKTPVPVTTVHSK